MARRDDALIPLDAKPASRPARATAPTGGPLFGDDSALLRVVLAVGIAVTLLKIAIAGVGNVIWEEAHFAVLGQHPAWGYADVPAGWPLFARLCTTLVGWSPFGLRLCGLLTAQALPFAVYFLTRPVGSRREALWAALLSMLIPALTVPGTVFYPEGALQALVAAMLGCAIRALRTDQLRWWALTGLAGGLGLFIHYRFVLAGAGVVLFALLSRDGRRMWTRPGLYLAGAVAALGLLPGVIYNATSGWPSVVFQVANRPDAGRGFHIGQSIHFLTQQAELATPVLLVALLAAGWAALKRERAGEAGLSLLFWTGAAIFGCYLLLSPVNRQIMPHWPFMAYVAWLPLVPRLLIGFVDKARSGGERAVRATLVGVGPVLTAVGVVGALGFQLAWAHPTRVPERLRPLLVSKLEDWRQLEPALDRARALTIQRFGGEPALAAAGHISALRLEFPGRPGRRVYALNEPYDEFSRFSVMRSAWGLDEAGLRRDHAGQGVVIALPEPSYLYHTPGEVAFRGRLCAAFDGLAPVEVLDMPPGRTAVELYVGRVRTQPRRTPEAAPCPLFPRLYLAQPSRAAVIQPNRQGNSFGVAADPKGISAVEVMLDGRPAAAARYGLDPPGARVSDALAFDPHYPRVQFDFQFPRERLTPGAHRVSLKAVRGDGSVLEGAARTIYVR